MNKLNDSDFEKDLSINKFKLDEECLSHSSRYAFYAEAQAIAKSNVSKAKDKLELVMSKCNLSIREDLNNKGVKYTEAIINSQLAINDEVIKAREEVRDCEETYYTLSVAVQSMEQRRSDLDNLVKLYCAGYFSSVSGDKKDITERVENEIRKNLNKKEN